MSMSITRRLEFDAGHRLLKHESRCANVHGHRYIVEVEATAPGLDDVGRIIDFGVLKQELGGWLDEHWDHAFIYEVGDPIGKWLGDNDQRKYALDVPPTAENIAEFLKCKFQALMQPHEIEIVSITVHETPNCKAVVRW